jgi:hypothetical protein
LALLVWGSGGPIGRAWAEDREQWTPLFDGKSIDGWKITQFGGQGEMGQPLTGITYKGTFPQVNYEISLEAMRVEGTDFFCGLTMPVSDSHCSFIVGGWAGSVVGISSIDGHDASENDTTKVMKFNNGQWYKFRVRVTADKIETWIDNEQVVNQDIKGRKITTRSEVDLSKPLGLSTYQTKAAVRNFKYRKLP